MFLKRTHLFICYIAITPNLILRNQLSLPGSAAICRKKIASSSQGDGICGEDLEIRGMIRIWKQNYDLMSNQTRQ